MSAPHKFTLSLPVRNEWGNVDLIRTSILNCFTVVFNDIDGCRAVAMVVGELLENAIKYGEWKGEERRLHLDVTGEDHRAVVTVENSVDAAGAPELFATLESLRTYPSAEEAYRAKLLAVAAAPRSLGASRLGLARIAYEGNCQLDAKVDGSIVRVTATLSY